MVLESVSLVFDWGLRLAHVQHTVKMWDVITTYNMGHKKEVPLISFSAFPNITLSLFCFYCA